ncbi:Muskelin 1, intracellular mediator containing kelch motif [Lobosporangium transversale]|nr:Muskelin 1, intracellular mediator containing kelch motif [Lobosporangium transversale]
MMLQPGPQVSLHSYPRLQASKNVCCAHKNRLCSSPSHITAANRRQGEYLTALAIMRPRVLDYDVHSCSSYSASYLPENIKINNPQDQSSRWSSGSNNQMQYIMIKLHSMAVARTFLRHTIDSITFGKYHKVHVCNLKEFKVFGGLTTSNMTELLHTGLRNDSEPETFLLKHKTNSVVFPCQYIKIVPLMAWGANFNFSVWHVEVKGVADPGLVQETYFQYINFRETESVRLCLKHFRQRNLTDAFEALQQRTNVQLEDPLLTKVYHELVIKGNFKRVEELMMEAAQLGLFDAYIQSYDYKPIWKRLNSNSHRQGLHHHHHFYHPYTEESPRHRGGHQMCIDTQGGYVYLMGGWDGVRDLADFWAYHIPSQKWILISADCSLQGGPSARSCHKICFSPQQKAIFLLGKYVDPEVRSKVDLSSDFWRFDIDPNSPPRGRWTKIAANTAAMNGPELIYDHQMCLDPVSQTLYVFGGRVVHLDKNVQHYSGLYSYHILSGIWRLLRTDGHPPPRQDGNTILRSRIGHSMLYDNVTRSLVIFAGQMNKDYLSDFYVYDIAADRVIEVCKDYNKQGGPEAGFTQRATVSPRCREIYVLSGLVKDRTLGAETVKNSFWVFKMPGKDQMDAIRDVQLALEDSSKAGGDGIISSFKSIMNRGRTCCCSVRTHTQADVGTTDEIEDGISRPRSVRRKQSNGRQQGRQEMRPITRWLSGRINSCSTAPPQLFTESTNLGLEQGPTRTMQTRSSSLGKKVSPRSWSPSVSSSQSSVAARFRNDPYLEPKDQEANRAAPNSKEGAIPGILYTTATSLTAEATMPLDLASNSDHHHRHHKYDSILNNNNGPIATATSIKDGPTIILTEPMTLAFVLSDHGSWQKIFQNSSSEAGDPNESEPVPRYAHQLVYDDVNEVQYLFGGNPGEQGNMSKRLDDFWELRLYRPNSEEVIRRTRYLVRTQQFKELCQLPETSALTSTTVLANSTSSSVKQQYTHHALGPEGPDTHHRYHHHSNSSSASTNGSKDGKTTATGATKNKQDQSSRALRFLQMELSSVLDQSSKAENEEFRTLIRGLLLGVFSPSSSSTSTSANMRKGMGPFGDNERPQRTSVLLAPSPIISPATDNAHPMFSAYPSQSTRSTVPAAARRPTWLPACNCCSSLSSSLSSTSSFSPSSSSSIFDANGQGIDSGREDSDSFMHEEDEEIGPFPSSLPPMYSRRRASARPLPPRRRRTTRSHGHSRDHERLDNNGEKVRHRDNTEDSQEEYEEEDYKLMLENTEMINEYDEETGKWDEDSQDELLKTFHHDRILLFERLLEFFAEEVKQPKGDLIDLIKVG